MKQQKVRLGLCPIGKFVFSHEDALRQKKAIEQKLRSWRVEFVGIDSVVKDGVVRGTDDIAPAVRHLAAAGIDGVFLPHCNFGTEHATALIGRDLGVPVLLWGPRDEAPLPDGTRLRDSLCGLLASSKILRRLRVPFTYIENCRIDDRPFEAGVKNFRRVMSIVKGFRNIRIGQIGERIDFFWTTIIDESDLLQKYRIEVLPLDMVNVIKATKERARKNEARYKREAALLKRKNVKVEGFQDLRAFYNVLALRDEMLALAERHGLSAFALQSFMSICDELGAMVEFAAGEVTAAGYPVACETDIHGAISCILTQRAALDATPAFFPEFTSRHPKNDNGVLLWHCGAPVELRKEDAPASIGTHWILPGIAPGTCHWRLRDGDITVARFDGEGGQYRLAAGAGHTIDGPVTQNVYVWMEVNDWPRWERQLIEGPYIHHCGAVYGRFTPALIEACKYLPGVTPEPLGQDLAEVQKQFFVEC
jgi:L-fucose isomerase-like protein